MHRAILLLTLMVPLLSWAQVEDLENPGSVSAVQQRSNLLQHELDLTLGALPLDAFYKHFYLQLGYVYHFSDTFAWQVGRGAYGFNAQTGLKQQLESKYGVLPTAVDQVQFFIGSDVMWTPMFGKVAVINRWVLRGEVFLLGGITLFKYTNAFRPAVNLGAGARIFINQYASVRLDVTDNIVLPTGAGSTGIGNAMAVTLSLAINFGSNE